MYDRYIELSRYIYHTYFLTICKMICYCRYATFYFSFIVKWVRDCRLPIICLMEGDVLTMDQPPSRIHLGKAIRQVARTIIRLPQTESLSVSSPSSVVFSKSEWDSVHAELYWFRLTALQIAVLLHIQQQHYDLNRYEARYMMTTAIELAFQDADLSRTDTTKIRSKLSEEMDYYFNRLGMSDVSDHLFAVEELLRSFATRTLILCISFPVKHDQDQRREILIQEATLIWENVTQELEEFLRHIKIIEFEQ